MSQQNEMDVLTNSAAAIDINQRRPLIDEILSTLNVENTANLPALEAHLQESGIPAPTKSYMARLMKLYKLKRCNNCVFVGIDRNELKSHLRERAHFYGQGEFSNEKRRLIDRAKKVAGNSYLPDVDINSKDPLTDKEKIAFKSLGSEATMDEALNGTYENILYVGFCLINLKVAKSTA